MDWYKFENLIRQLFEAMGLDGHVTHSSRDEEIDAVAYNKPTSCTAPRSSSRPSDTATASPPTTSAHWPAQWKKTGNSRSPRHHRMGQSGTKAFAARNTQADHHRRRRTQAPARRAPQPRRPHRLAPPPQARHLAATRALKDQAHPIRGDRRFAEPRTCAGLGLSGKAIGGGSRASPAE